MARPLSACYLRGVSRVSFAALLTLLIATAAAAPAHAYEDQASFDAELSYVHAFADSGSREGVALGLGASLGLSNVLTLRGQLVWALHPSDAPVVSVFLATAELVYVVDVFDIVPYFGAGIDGIGSVQSGRDFQPDFGVHPIIGADWIVSREFALGLQVRPVFVLTALDAVPLYFKVGVSLSYLFDL